MTDKKKPFDAVQARADLVKADTWKPKDDDIVGTVISASLMIMGTVMIGHLALDRIAELEAQNAAMKIDLKFFMRITMMTCDSDAIIDAATEAVIKDAENWRTYVAARTSRAGMEPT